MAKTFKDVEQTHTKSVVDQITCDKCGVVIVIDATHAFTYGGSIRIDAGYGSRFDGEFDCHEFDLCDNCIEELSKSLKWVSPQFGGM
jgi:hypothetical protein